MILPTTLSFSPTQAAAEASNTLSDNINSTERNEGEIKLQTVYFSGIEKQNNHFSIEREDYKLVNISSLSVALVGSPTPTRTVACLSHTPSPLKLTSVGAAARTPHNNGATARAP